MTRKTIHEQIQAVEREIAMRRRVYPRWVESQKMTQSAADHEIAAMEAVRESLNLVYELEQFRRREDERLGEGHGGLLVPRPFLDRIKALCAWERP